MSMSRTVCIDAFEFEVEITSCVSVAPNSSTWASDWDYYGYREMEFEVTGGAEFDEDGNSTELSKARCAELAEQYADTIEDNLWNHLADEADDCDDYHDRREWEPA